MQKYNNTSEPVTGSIESYTDISLYSLSSNWFGFSGLAMHAAPAYIAETAPPSVRGLLISCKEAAIVGGILLGCGYYSMVKYPNKLAVHYLIDMYTVYAEGV